MHTHRFRHVIPLGFFCSVADALKSCGLRDASYPLDWTITRLPGVLKLLDTGFEGFLDETALQRHGGFPHIVQNANCMVDFYHDFGTEGPIGARLPAVREKYARRIARLDRAAREGALFVRYVLDAEELAHVAARHDEIRALLRRFNPGNDIVFIANSDIRAPLPEGVKIHYVRKDAGDSVARRFLLKSPSLIWRFLKLDYPWKKRLANIRRGLSARGR